MTGAPPPPGRRTAAQHAAVLALLGAAFFAPGLFLGQLPVYRDLLVLTLPLREHAAQALRHAELPLWSTDLFFGAPFLANWQSGVLYPFTLVFVAVPLPASLSLYLALHVFVAALGAARFLAVTLGLRATAALFGGIVFGFGGFVFSLVSLTNQLTVAAWLPWVLLVVDRLVVTGKPGWFLWLTALLALQLLGGAPEAALVTHALVAVELLRRRPPALRAGAVASALVAAIGLCGAQILPALEYFGRTSRAEVLPFAEVAAESLEVESFLQLILPHTFEGGAPGFVPEAGVPLFWSLYLGAAPLIFVVTALVRRPPAFWLLVAMVATLLALGANTFLLPFLYFLFPQIVGAFRFPGKIFLAGHLALSILAAFGLERVLGDSGARRAVLVAIGALAGLGLTVQLASALAPEALLRGLGYDLHEGLSAESYAAIAAPVGGKGIRLAVFSLIVGLLAALLDRGRIAAPVFAGMAGLITFVDLLIVHQPSLAFVDWSSLHAAETVSSTAIEPGQRVFHYAPDGAGGLEPWVGRIRIAEPLEERARSLWTALVPDLPLLYGIGAVAGVDGFTPRDRHDFHQALAGLPTDGAVRLLAALGIARLVGTKLLHDYNLRLVFSRNDPNVYVYAPVTAASRSYLADRIVVANSRMGALVHLASEGFRPGRDAVVTETGSEPVSGGTIEEISFGRSTVRAVVSLPAPGLWVVQDTWDPGWEASIEGEPAEILHVNGIVRGVRLPAGRHHVEMRYRPASFRRGAILSVLTGACLLTGMAVLSIGRHAASRADHRES